MKNECVEHITSEHLGYGISIPNYHYGYVLENTSRGTSIVNIKFDFISIKLKKFFGFWKKKKTKVMPFYYDRDYNIEVKSDELTRDLKIMKHIKESNPEYAKKIRELRKDSWVFDNDELQKIAEEKETQLGNSKFREITNKGGKE